MVPTGLTTEFDSDYVAILKERGSTGTKGLAVRSGVVDSGFRGEWFAVIENVTEHNIYYPINKAVAQVVFLKKYDVEFIEGELGDSERGETCLGESGK